MRVLSVFGLVVLVSIGCGRTASEPEGTTAPPPAAPKAASPQVHATLAQVMRGILFPNSNLLFDVQTKDPAALKLSMGTLINAEQPKGQEGGAGAKFAAIYTGWEVVEYSSLALAEAANLLIVPGRTCQNGRPVPLDREDWPKLVQGLRDAGMEAYKVAQTKNQEAFGEATFKIADACDACHSVYREKPDIAQRCIP